MTWVCGWMCVGSAVRVIITWANQFSRKGFFLGRLFSVSSHTMYAIHTPNHTHCVPTQTAQARRLLVYTFFTAFANEPPVFNSYTLNHHHQHRFQHPPPSPVMDSILWSCLLRRQMTKTERKSESRNFLMRAKKVSWPFPDLFLSTTVLASSYTHTDSIESSFPAKDLSRGNILSNHFLPVLSSNQSRF